jgi:hypothetical protein
LIAAKLETVELELRDETLARMRAPGMTIKTDYQVKPGSYQVQLVVRDAEGQLMSPRNGAVVVQ